MVTSLSDYEQRHYIATTFYNDAIKQSENGNRTEAIRLYSKAIENYPPEDSYAKSEAYYNRGYNKRNINDLKGAISDYTEAIKLRPDYYKAYNNRGFARMKLEDYTGAIADFTSVIKYDNYNTEYTNMAFGNRGLAKLNIGQEGCADLKKAVELGNNSVSQTLRANCK